jgi:methylated-DNA-protein-cysteine methyltransferase-like protein
MKSFNEQVYDVVARIPSGRVATYGQIAQIIGRPRMARFVGYASNNKNSLALPWHRVVFKDGSLCAGYAPEQYKLLRAEGVGFKKGRLVDITKYQWRLGNDMPPPEDIRDWPLKF